MFIMIMELYTLGFGNSGYPGFVMDRAMVTMLLMRKTMRTL